MIEDRLELLENIIQSMIESATETEEIRSFERGYPEGWMARSHIDGSSEFSGDAYAPNGSKTANLDSSTDFPFIKYSASTNAFSQEAGPMPSPWGDGDVWYVKENTSGDIIVTRLG